MLRHFNVPWNVFKRNFVTYDFVKCNNLRNLRYNSEDKFPVFALSDATSAPTPTIIKNIFEKWKILNFKPRNTKAKSRRETKKR